MGIARYINTAADNGYALSIWEGREAADKVRSPCPHGPGYEFHDLSDREKLAADGLTLTKTSGAVFVLYMDRAAYEVPVYGKSFEWRLWDAYGKCVWQRMTPNPELKA